MAQKKVLFLTENYDFILAILIKENIEYSEIAIRTPDKEWERLVVDNNLIFDLTLSNLDYISQKRSEYIRRQTLKVEKDLNKLNKKLFTLQNERCVIYNKMKLHDEYSIGNVLTQLDTLINQTKQSLQDKTNEYGEIIRDVKFNYRLKKVKNALKPKDMED